MLRDARGEDAKALNLPDPFHEACSLYELAVLQINQGGYHEAERLLRDLGSARSGFSFETVLQYRFKAAREYVHQQMRGGGGRGGGRDQHHHSQQQRAPQAGEEEAGKHHVNGGGAEGASSSSAAAAGGRAGS